MFRKTFVCFFIFLFSYLNGSPNVNYRKPFVTCWLKHGQLGNQLHQIATTLAYAWDYNVNPIFPALNNNEYNLKINRDHIFFRLDASDLPRGVRHVFKHLPNFEKKVIPFKKDQMLEGYFQTWEYYHHHRDRLLKIFEPKQERLDYISEKFQNILKHPCTVGVHVRTFNKHWSHSIPFVGLDYYERAFKFFPENTLFVIFSDRINWCKHHFKKFNVPMVFIEGQDYLNDFFLMSMMKHNIIANSSYSWWAAYLNTNPKKIVVGPNHFINPTFMKKTNALLPDWIELPINLSAPYPEDIKAYDAYSQSIDTQ